jgi:hypothetical protein
VELERIIGRLKDENNPRHYEVAMSPMINKITGIVVLLLIAMSFISLSACVRAGSTTEEKQPQEMDPILVPNPGEADRELFQTPYPVEDIKLPEPLRRELPGGKLFSIDNVFIDSKEIVEMKDAPSGYGLRLVGTMPTPCHRLIVDIPEPNELGHIYAEAYATAKPGEVCIQIIEEFDFTQPLEVYDPDTNTIWVNGEQGFENQ